MLDCPESRFWVRTGTALLDDELAAWRTRSVRSWRTEGGYALPVMPRRRRPELQSGPCDVRAAYHCGMSIVTIQSESLRTAIARQRGALDAILRRYAATNPRLFGSVARGDATADSDIDLLVDLLPGGGNELLRVSGIAEELTELLGTRVDVVATSLLRGEVSSSALEDAVAV